VPIVSLGCIALVPRLGAKRITLASACLMAVSTVIFAWAPTVLVLILARFVQGFASGSIWTASMAWVTDNAPTGRRGRESGIVMGMLSAGSVAGPAVGALASWAGQGPAFGLVAVVSVVGVILAAVAPSGRNVAPQSGIGAALVRVARQPATRAALALTTVDLLVFGTVDVLVPLQLGDRGAVCGPIAGRVVDRYGPGMVGIAAQSLMILIPVALVFEPATAVQLAVLVIGGPLFAAIGAAIFPLSSLGADAAGVSHVTATGLMGAVWATGFTVVPVFSGALAQVASDPTAYLVVLLLSIPLLTLVVRNGLAVSASGTA
jgi:MFS family permease